MDSWGGRGEEDRRGSQDTWRQMATPFFLLTLTVKGKKDQTSSTASVNLMPELTQLLETHSAESVSVSSPVFFFFNSFFFFLMWTIFKVFTEFVTILLLFYVLGFFFFVFLALRHVKS